MKKIKAALLFLGGLCPFLSATPLDSERVLGILNYGQTQTQQLGTIWTLLQGQYFTWLYVAVFFGVILGFVAHYLAIGAKTFNHNETKITFFNLFNRIIHWISAIGFILLVPTGLIMIWGDFFGGGAFVRVCRILHSIGCVIFTIAVLPMFLMWVKDMFFKVADLQWLLIMGGYLSKEKREVPAYKFNAGQKMWFWVATLGGLVMIASGAILYFNNLNLSFLASSLGIYQISLLRLVALIHNFLGLVIIGLFITHLYMSLFAIKGSLHSMINGKKEIEEVKILHSLYYKEKIKG
ncbi:formate dehydrogenase subunit gamma [Helicobacter cetorum]|uniref:Putative formate dehydrogenase subunit C n=1 Tax=Helicobacter cetorum (strain ATCC BAA-429 / MIT 00-7128) TaxID=182217 RepID=I0ENQ7_HELC0|nr:formate dehydrogenase subunit gamma [Helicobacter cetorum]AFI04576.1 putative formate dehydrogenase subunit C [Helicobacter cetorum MIT 00-7128]